ncbi:hypothetical protein HK101_006761 [Irineochytrium annulatum]|nr:hypothetical protein HK101_006761 [Irineochytrium annulatum]
MASQAQPLSRIVVPERLSDQLLRLLTRLPSSINRVVRPSQRTFLDYVSHVEGADKVYRLISYTLRLIASTHASRRGGSHTSLQALLRLADQVADARVILRCFGSLAAFDALCRHFTPRSAAGADEGRGRRGGPRTGPSGGGVEDDSSVYSATDGSDIDGLAVGAGEERDSLYRTPRLRRRFPVPRGASASSLPGVGGTSGGGVVLRGRQVRGVDDLDLMDLGSLEARSDDGDGDSEGDGGESRGRTGRGRGRSGRFASAVGGSSGSLPSSGPWRRDVQQPSHPPRPSTKGSGDTFMLVIRSWQSIALLAYYPLELMHHLTKHRIVTFRPSLLPPRSASGSAASGGTSLHASILGRPAVTLDSYNAARAELFYRWSCAAWLAHTALDAAALARSVAEVWAAIAVVGRQARLAQIAKRTTRTRWSLDGLLTDAAELGGSFARRLGGKGGGTGSREIRQRAEGPPEMSEEHKMLMEELDALRAELRVMGIRGLGIVGDAALAVNGAAVGHPMPLWMVGLIGTASSLARLSLSWSAFTSAG